MLAGFRLSNRALSAIILRFSNKKGEIEFDDFVLCAIRLKTMIGWLHSTVEEFTLLIMV
ncbi:hypothetical protein DPMN_099117 [Dreissena polymorpha]|uniref:EF-hand domain-containing protein n=1 Tax=Dreissena polymorpha TaxID=45954 RepID=A0A9D4LFX1_DREPO|nr:hypothetical protein DPMN_099117 [Dreissena polymorpha]